MNNHALIEKLEFQRAKLNGGYDYQWKQDLRVVLHEATAALDVLARERERLQGELDAAEQHLVIKEAVIQQLGNSLAAAHPTD